MLTCCTSLDRWKFPTLVCIYIVEHRINVLCEHGDTIFHWHIILSPVRISTSSHIPYGHSVLCTWTYVNVCSRMAVCLTRVGAQNLLSIKCAVTFGPDQHTDFHAMCIADKHPYNKPRMWCNETLSKHTRLLLILLLFCVVSSCVCVCEFHTIFTQCQLVDFHRFDVKEERERPTIWI